MRRKKKLFSWCILGVFFLCASACGCRKAESYCFDRRLSIGAITDESAGFTTIKPDELGGNFEEDIVYVSLSDVNITINREECPLEEAIRKGLITVEEIFAYARIDARNGICTEKYITDHSLTTFLYRYPEVDLYITYDVFNSPNGKQHLINDLLICRVGADVGTFYKDEETGESISREDWGIQFEVVKTTSTNLVLKVGQSEGQQIGELYLERYGIYRTENRYESIEKLDGTKMAVTIAPSIQLQKNNAKDVFIDWEDEYGVLPSGNYTMFIYVQDIFDAASVHPLMDDFSDNQIYWIEFSVP